MHLEDGTIVRVPDDHLPVTLPDMESFTPSSDGSAPLARAKAWLHTTDPATGRPALRDTDTMPGWAGSCWYWLRFMDPHNEREPFSAEAQVGAAEWRHRALEAIAARAKAKVAAQLRAAGR